MPEQQTVNPPVNSNSGSSSSQDTNQSTPKVDDTIDELLQGEEEREKKKSWIDSMLEAAKRRNMALRGISQKDLEEGRTPESVKHLYTITSEELLNPHKARDFVTRGSKFIREERQKEKDTMLAGPTYEYEHDNIIYKGMRVPSGRSVPLTKEEIRKGYVKGATIYEQKYQITHDDPTYIKDYFFRTGKHPAQDPNSNWTLDERREGKQSWRGEEWHKEWEAKRARDARDPAVKEANEWLESDEGRKAEKNISDSYQVKRDTLLEEEEANKWGHRFSRRDYYDRYKKLEREEYDAINQLKSDRINRHETRAGHHAPGANYEEENMRLKMEAATANATQTVHSNVSQQKEKQMYQDAVDRAASGPVADGPANTNVKLPRGEHQAPVVEEPQPVEELTPLRLSPDSGRDKLLPHIEQLLPPEPPPAHIISELNNQQQDNRDVDAAIAPIQAGFISGPPASNTVENPTWGLREWTTLGLMGETARQLGKTVSKRRLRTKAKADAPAPTDTSGKKSAKVRPLGTKWNPLNWRRTMPGGTINPSGKSGPTVVEGGVPRPPGYEGPISVSGGDAPVPEFTPEQIAHQREYQQRHAESIKRRRAAAKAAEAKRKTTLPTVDLTPAPEVATDYYETKWEEFKRKIQTPTQARLDAVELELPPRTFDATPEDAAKTKKVLSDINADLVGPTHMEQTIENAGYGDSGDGKRKTPSHIELTREYAGDPGDYIPPEELLDAPSPEEIREINAAKKARAGEIAGDVMGPKPPPGHGETAPAATETATVPETAPPTRKQLVEFGKITPGLKGNMSTEALTEAWKKAGSPKLGKPGAQGEMFLRSGPQMPSEIGTPTWRAANMVAIGLMSAGQTNDWANSPEGEMYIRQVQNDPASEVRQYLDPSQPITSIRNLQRLRFEALKQAGIIAKGAVWDFPKDIGKGLYEEGAYGGGKAIHRALDPIARLLGFEGSVTDYIEQEWHGGSPKEKQELHEQMMRRPGKDWVLPDGTMGTYRQYQEQHGDRDFDRQLSLMRPPM